MERRIRSLQERVAENLRKKGFVLSFETFGAFKSCLEEMLSPSAASVILHFASSKCGQDTCLRILKTIKTKENVLAYLSNMKNEMNWGKILFQDVDIEAGRGEIFVYNSFEVAACKSASTSCYFIKGYLAGFLSELFEREIRVEEEQCAATGAPYCRFSFK